MLETHTPPSACGPAGHAPDAGGHTPRPSPGPVEVVECEGPRLSLRGYSRYAVLIRVEPDAGGPPIGYATAIAVVRPRAGQASYVFLEGFSAEDQSLAWHRFADHVNQLAVELANEMGPPCEGGPVPRILPMRPRGR